MALKLRESGSDGGKGINELNFLGEGTYLDGSLETKGSLRVDGKVKGAIKAGDTLTIGSTGVVSGEIHARMAVVGGKIEGDISVDEKLVLESNSTLVGNLNAKKLVIDEGAVFQGKSNMGVSKQTSATTATVSKEKGEEQGGGEQPEKSG